MLAQSAPSVIEPRRRPRRRSWRRKYLKLSDRQWATIYLSFVAVVGLLHYYDLRQTWLADAGTDGSAMESVTTRQLLSSGGVTCDSSFDKNGGIALYFIGVMYMFIGLAIVCDDYFVAALEEISEALSLSEDVAGATFMAAGSSAPELATSFVATFSSGSSLGAGTIVGSAVFNILIIVALTAVFSGQKSLQLDWRPLSRDSLFYGLSIVLLMIFFWSGDILWWEALILLLGYIGYCVFMVFNERIMTKFFPKKDRRPLSREGDLDGDEADTVVPIKSSTDHTEGVPITTAQSTGTIEAAPEQKAEASSTPAQQEPQPGTSVAPAGNDEQQPESATRSERAPSDDVGHRRGRAELSVVIDSDAKNNDDAAKGNVPAGNNNNNKLNSSTASSSIPPPDGDDRDSDDLVDMDSDHGDEFAHTGGPGHLQEPARARTVSQLSVPEARSVPASPSMIVPNVGPLSPGAQSTTDSNLPHTGTDSASRTTSAGGSGGLLPHERNLSASVGAAPKVIPPNQPPPRLSVNKTSSQNLSASAPQVRPPLPNAQPPSRPALPHHTEDEDDVDIADDGGADDRAAPAQPPNRDAPSPVPPLTPTGRDSPSGLRSTTSGDGKGARRSSLPFNSTKGVEEGADGDDKSGDEEDEEDEHPLAFPDSIGGWIWYILVFPYSLLMWLTIPNCAKDAWKKWYVVTFVMSIVWIGGLSYFMVLWSEVMGCIVGIPPAIMGLTFVAAGTSVPDALSSLSVARDGAGDMAVSNAIGSNVFDILLGLGLPWFCYAAMTPREPFVVSSDDLVMYIFILFGVLAVVIVCVWSTGWRLHAIIGYIFLGLYIVFAAWALINNYVIKGNG